MPKTRIVHALLGNDASQLVVGAFYETLCGTTQEHGALSAEDMRHSAVCALCVDRQNEEIIRAIESLLTAYNRHLELFHPKTEEFPQSERTD